MFTLRRAPRAPNPLHTFAENAADTYYDQTQMRKRNEEIKKGFESLGENPSRIDILQTIEGLNIPDAQKKRLYDGFSDIERSKVESEKMSAAREAQRESNESRVKAAEIAAQGRANAAEQRADIEKGKQEAAQKRVEYTANRKESLQALKPPPGGYSAQAPNPELVNKIEEVLSRNTGANAEKLGLALAKAGIPAADAAPYVETRRREDENKLKSQEIQAHKVDKSYEAQKGFIDKTTAAYKGWKTEMEPRLQQIQKINRDEDLISPTAAKFLELLDIPLGVLENPSNEVYAKLSQDLLKGLPETYGNRILKVEVENFLQTIPRLINSPNGRRMIASNMLKLGEMKEVFYNEMRNLQKQYLDEDKPFPKDFEQRVFDNTVPMMNQLNQDFVQLSSVKDVPKGHIPFFDPQGTITFIPDNPKAIEWAIANKGRRIW